MPSQQRTFESRIDYSLLLPVLLLLSIGVTAIYIAVSHDYPNNVLQIVGQQVVWILLGFLISFIVMFLFVAIETPGVRYHCWYVSPRNMQSRVS